MKTVTQTHKEAKSVIPSKSVPTKLPAALMQAVQKGATLLNKLTENEIDQLYSLGVLVRDAMDHKTYGDAALAAFSDELHIDEDTLRNYAMVTRIWAEKEFNDLAARRGGAKGTYRFSWSHFILVAGEKDGRVRQGLINVAFKKLLSEKNLRVEKAGRGAAPMRNRRAQSASDESVTSPVSLVDLAKDWLSKGEQLNSMLEASADATADIGQLKDADDSLVQLERLVADARARIAQAVARNAGTVPTNVVQLPPPLQFMPAKIDQIHAAVISMATRLPGAATDNVQASTAQVSTADQVPSAFLTPGAITDTPESLP